MPHDDSGTRLFRKLVVILILCMALGVATVGGIMAWRGQGFYSLLALLVLGWLILVVHGYRQDEREKQGRGGP
jgi:hypothetical protein